MALGYLLSITLGYLSNTSDTTYDDSADDEEMVEETTPADGFITEIADEPQTTEPAADPEVSAPEKRRAPMRLHQRLRHRPRKWSQTQ